MFETTPSSTKALSHMSTWTCIVSSEDNFLTKTDCHTYLIPLWGRHNWTPTLSHMCLFRFNRALKHPETSDMSKVIHKSFGDALMPPELKAEIESICCWECAETPEIPRKLKILPPPESTPNVVVSLDVMQHKIRNHPTDI